MKKRKICIQLPQTYYYHAGFKARIDCDSILKSHGYNVISLPSATPTFFSRIIRIFNLFKLIYILYGAEKCFLQYPLHSYLIKPLVWHFIFGFFSGKIEVLIHDIDKLRNEGFVESELCYLLKKCDKVIVHTPQMKKFIEKYIDLQKTKVSVLYLFDYLSKENTQPANISENKIIFAGNLEKSTFLSKINLLPHTISFNLYGVYHKNIKEDINCTYMGKFSPENISFLKGNWGLVWDGDQLDTCHGTFGDYLKINSSHKISLYIAACKPVILWKESSISEFIVSNHLGIAVNSLYEIPERLAALTSAERLTIETSVNSFSTRLKNGEMLNQCI